jgi:hypothetical protein
VGCSFEHVRKSKHVWAGRLIGRNSCLAPATVTGALDVSQEHGQAPFVSPIYPPGSKRGPRIYLRDDKMISENLRF